MSVVPNTAGAPARPSPSRWEGPALSWPAIFAGALAALGLSIMLVILGSAFGFGAMSPFSGDGLSATTVGAVTILWLIFTQIFASAAGGYLAGRMRTRWAIHSDEVYFRDTVHGFLTWALASAAMFTLAGLVAAAGAAAGTAMTSAALASPETAAAPSTVIADRLYRSPGANPELLAAARLEADRLVVRAIADEDAVTGADRNWLNADVAEWTGLDAADSAARVDAAFAEIDLAREDAREAVDTARAASATLAIATALALLVGAFVASLASVYGGRERDGLEDSLV
ncbi:hypothetical protein [Hyphomonas sp.]|uniref:hypothetical protein n=1 Tax=Hyphomonas sp. TaxID=87 RepID=UPI00391D732D